MPLRPFPRRRTRTRTTSSALRELLDGRERPLVLVGGQPWDARGARGARRLVRAERSAGRLGLALPGLRRQPLAALRRAPRAGRRPAARRSGCAAADVLLVIGTRLGDIETAGVHAIVPPGTGAAARPRPSRPARSSGASTRRTLGIVASGLEFATALARLPTLDPTLTSGDDGRGARANFLDNLVGRELPGAVDPTAVMALLAERLDDDTILTNGAGNFTVWAHRFWSFRRYRTQLAPLSGAMAYGLPAAIAAELVHPDRTVVCFAGDGDFLMSLPELATAVQYELPIVMVVFDNGMYGTIRMHQERQYPAG